MFVHCDDQSQATSGVKGGVVLWLTLLNPFPVASPDDAATTAPTGVADPLLITATATIPAISSSLLTIGIPVIATAAIRGVTIPVLEGVCALGEPIMAEGGVPVIAEGDCHPGLAPSPAGTWLPSLGDEEERSSSTLEAECERWIGSGTEREASGPV